MPYMRSRKAEIKSEMVYGEIKATVVYYKTVVLRAMNNTLSAAFMEIWRFNDYPLARLKGAIGVGPFFNGG